MVKSFLREEKGRRKMRLKLILQADAETFNLLIMIKCFILNLFPENY